MTKEELDKLTPEQKRIRIAELCGWETAHGYWWNEGLDKTRPKEDDGIRCNTPDYLNDLNAMNEAEKVLDEIQQQLYVNTLLDESDAAVGVSEYEVCAFATAAQRADAFLLTLRSLLAR